MDTILDYIRWRGDIPFSVDGLREADALVLCMLSYYDLKPMWADHEGPIHLRDCQKLIDAGPVPVMLAGKDMNYQEIFAQAVASRRFGDLLISDYVDQIRDEPPMQFAALCFHDESGISFLAYRGTDDSLAGWEEDFMIGFMRTEAQVLALRYAEAHLTTGRRWYMGGHSKGGNLALFVACSLQQPVLELLERIFILDGPGLCEEVMDISGMKRIDSRSTRIIPRFSVIGKLFEPQITDSRIVRSNASGMTQHSLATWGIDHGGLDLCGENDPRSRWINAAVGEWIEGISQEDRVVFVRELFDALSANGARTLEELDDAGAGGFENILRCLLTSSEVTKKTISDLPRQAVSQVVSAASQVVSAATHLLRNPADRREKESTVNEQERAEAEALTGAEK